MQGWNRLRDSNTLCHDGCVNTAAWNTCGDLLCTGSDDRRAKIWRTHYDFSQLEEGGDVATGHQANIFHCSFVPYASDRQILTCAADGQFWVSDCCAAVHGQGSKKLHEGDGMAFMFEWCAYSPARSVEHCGQMRPPPFLFNIMS